MHNEQVEAISAELVSKWGHRTREAIKPLNALMAEALSHGDLLAFSFIAQAIGQVVTEAVGIAKNIQGEQHEAKGHLH